MALSVEIVRNYGWSVPVIPPVTAGGYSAGDIMGALMTFSSVAPGPGQAFILQEVQCMFRSAVTPSLELVLFNADPTSTTKTDNAPYSLDVADAFKVIAVLPINALGGYLVDHGTPNSITLTNLSRTLLPGPDTRDIYGLLVDLTGVTLSSTSDLQVRLAGI